MTENKAKLFNKMAQVMGALSRIPKRGKNTFYNYEYVTDADVLDAVRRAMSDAHLAFFFTVGDVRRVEAGQTRKGEPKVITEIDLALTFCDGETGETHTIETMGEAMDSEDKGYNKALTAGIKYALLKTFLISTGEDDPDANSEGPAVKQSAAPAAARQPAQSAAPHWIDNDKVRGRFWAWAHSDLGLSDAEVHAALAVEHVHDYAGTMADAKNAIEHWLAERPGESALDELTKL